MDDRVGQLETFEVSEEHVLTLGNLCLTRGRDEVSRELRDNGFPGDLDVDSFMKNLMFTYLRITNQAYKFN